MIGGLPSMFIQSLALIAIIRICFQSKSIIPDDGIDLSEFKLSSARSREFPDERLKFIRQNIKSDTIHEACMEFIETKKGQPEHEILLAVYQGNVQANELHTFNSDADIELHHYIYQLLYNLFLSQKSESYKDNEHFNLVNSLLKY